MQKQNLIQRFLVQSLIIGFIILNSFNGFSQITISYLIGDNTIFKQNDIWNFIILNTSNDLSCSINVRLSDKEDQEILLANSPQFNLKNGTNNNFNFLKNQSEIIYGNNEQGENLRTNGILLSGEYQLCIKLNPNDNTLQYSEKCVDFTAKEFFVLKLLYPPDNGEIVSNQPVLHWLSTNSSPGTRYALKLTILNEGQTENEALESNQLYIDETNLSNNSLLYPFSSPALEAKRNYVWQVAAVRNQKVIAVTEPWVFHLVNLDTIVIGKSDCYRLIHNVSNNEYYVNDGTLRFGYQNIANDKYLDYQIVNLDNKKTYKGKTKIPLVYGLNKIDMVLKNELKLKKNTRHLLRILDSDNNTYDLIFNIVDDGW